MSTHHDQNRIDAIAERVVAELRARGYADGNGGGSSAGLEVSPQTPARIRDYLSPSPTKPYSARASVETRPASAGHLRPEDPGVSENGHPTVTANVSNRQIHLTAASREVLFGPGAQLSSRNMLMQPDQFAAEQTVSMIAGRGRTIQNVRILGPLRDYDQVEISRTDAFFLGINPPVRPSGNHDGSAGCTLVGPHGTLVMEKGVIVADRHIHTPRDVARKLGFSDNEMIHVRVGYSEKPTVLEKVRIRIHKNFLFEMHIDNDDANACGISSGDRVELIY